MSPTVVRALICAALAATAAACRGDIRGTDAAGAIGAPAAPAPSIPPGGVAAARLDMEAIFPRGEGRDLVLDNCLTCHSFVRFVLLQRTPEQWAYTRRTMRPQVPHLDEAQADRLFDYLEEHFNDHTPVPALPEWFLQSFVW